MCYQRVSASYLGCLFSTSTPSLSNEVIRLETTRICVYWIAFLSLDSKQDSTRTHRIETLHSGKLTNCCENTLWLPSIRATLQHASQQMREFSRNQSNVRLYSRSKDPTAPKLLDFPRWESCQVLLHADATDPWSTARIPLIFIQRI